MNSTINHHHRPEQKCVDGNWAVAHVAYRTNDCAYIFPITPSSPMGEEVDAWAAEHKKNLFGQELKVVEMQSEAGAAGALHGALVLGALATTFTASQGLLLYIPNLYKIAGELLPTVIHVASRALAGEALSIYGDHSDVMLVRGCGLAMLSSFSVQEAHDMAAIAQVATLNSRVPFLHFMDGFRTSHEVNKIELISDEQLKALLPYDKMEEHRQRGLSPMHPTQRGTAQGPDVFMQLVESSNTYYQAVDNIIEQAMTDFETVTGRSYHPYEYAYYGTTQPTVAIITMGSSVRVVDRALHYLKSEQVCLIAIRMFRPWVAQKFVAKIPHSVQRIAVLDRTREGGAQGEPLYLDVCTSLQTQHRQGIFVAGGRYGLGSKDFTPRMVQSVIQNMLRKDVHDIQHPFTVGISDDVTHLSLPLGRPLSTIGDEVTQCVFYGFGSDGTVGANKAAIKMIGDYQHQAKVQAYFEYDAKKSSGWTVSHMRFSPGSDIDAPFRIEDGQGDYVACHNESYVQANKFDIVKFLKRRGTFFLNTTVASIANPQQRMEALEALVCHKTLRKLALKNAKFYVMDAGRWASKFGLDGRINVICMCVFFRLSGVLPLDDAIALLKASIRKTYSYKGEDVVQKNIDLLDTVVSDPESLLLVDIPKKWRSFQDTEQAFAKRHVVLIDDEKARQFMQDIGDPVARLEGDSIPISKFLQNNLLGGVMIPGTSKYEKRNPNPSKKIPVWEPNNCTQCNQCVFICPHAAIRPFVVTKDEASLAPYPKTFQTLKASGVELQGKRYTLQVSILDCTGCNACVEACPETPKALEMTPIEDVLPSLENWEFSMKLPERGHLVDKNSVRGSQFQTPLMEFSGACSGCGETPYFKLLTQLFGQRMLIANATGCSTIWGGSFPSNPYTVNKETGRGPAWANSLFEDNAEYGLGMFSATQHRRKRLVHYVQDFVHQMELSPLQDDQLSELIALLNEWLEIRDEKSDRCTLLFDQMAPLFKSILLSLNQTDSKLNDQLQNIWSERDMFPKLSQWICGGDGWAYDIGFSGIDQDLAFEANDVNVLVVDTEMYSNTGGQQSKATPAGAAVKFAMGGKQQKKKSLGEMFMTYEHVYVASVALHNAAQVLQAFWEADQYHGPSIIIAYAPCIQQGVRPAGLNDMYDESKLAVESGYWPLYRYNPDLTKQGQNPFVLDSKKLRKDVTAFLQRESRFINLRKRDPKVADTLWEQVTADVNHRMEHLQQLAEGYKNFSHPSTAKIKVLFASETGTAARVARDFANACPDSATASALDDIDLDEDINGKTVVLFVSTCGQGAMPRNGKNLYHELCQRAEPLEQDTKFLIFGLGDSSYYFYLKAAKDIQERLIALGATQLLDMGEGDDAAEEGMEAGLHDWLERVWPTLKIPPPSEVPHIQTVNVTFSNRAVLRPDEDRHMLEQYYRGVHAINTTIVSNDLMCRPDYNRDFRKIHLMKTNTVLETYQLGDALEIFPQNDPTLVSQFLHDYSPDYGENTVVQVHQVFGIHGEISLAALFTHILDLFGKPTKHFLQELATFAKSEGDKEMLLDPMYLRKASQQTGMTFADVLMQFRTANPPLPALLGMIPQIKPRAYSIASAPHASHIELLVLIDTWWCDAGMKYGLTCNMLRKLHPSDTLWCRIHPGSMEPPSPEDPVVCAGIGSGLAPHMAFLRDRVRAAEAGETVGPFSLYFGNRYRAEEYLYETELTEYARKYSAWFRLHVAFSRDDPDKKVYVQDLVGDTDDARLNLRDQSGLLYVCGNRQLPKPLQQALVKSFCRPNGDDENEVAQATKAVEDLYLHGKAQQEVW